MLQPATGTDFSQTATKVELVIFDAAAIQAVLKWKFKPRVIDGVPVKQVGLTTIEFNL